ncbi:hypothetical protein B0A54_14494 [Friedmanniomyces endolithicus]|uniref:Erythromycin esterase n=1 Tax=Friedmanniomyces endolithicus TaxID=329885 RepID=A0A4U0U8V8_9PEZI|nr:hypothetical protein B0A54_14494 [Friedmanniomyces endolithicus]
MARRSSARLRSRQSSTPKRVSLSHEITGRTPRTAPNKLESLSEHDDEMPGAFPNSPPADGTPTRAAKRINTGLEATPRERTPIKPSDSEMHPQKHHGTTVKPMQEARHLGFSNMGAFTEPPKQTSRIATLHGTPTRAPNPAHDTNDATYQFTFRREHSLELSPEAKRLMMEKREEAARIREQMIASEESKKQGDALEAAEPKDTGAARGKKHGRFSESTSTQAPLLARSPLKMTFTKHQVETSASNDSDKQATVPLLARSPSKIALPTNPVTASSPGRAYGLGLMGRFNLLRASPMKSILRSPQRLYSDDPAKVAAGTHFATPPKPKRSQAAEIKDMVEGSLRKRVDFSNSTKARDESKDSRSSETPTSSALKVASQITIQSPGAGKATLMDVDYPTLPNMVSTGDDSARAPSVSPSPQKRRQTITPGDFTFRADGHGTINFGGEARSPGAGVDVMRSCGGRPSIRHVSSEPQVFTAATAVAAAPPPPMAQGSKKRKFEFENEHMSAGNMSGAEDKENDVARDSKAFAEREDEDAEHRPLKRTRMSAPSLEKKPRISTYNSPTKSSAAAATNVTGTGNATTRLPTLGVKPKGTKTAVGGGKGPKKNGSGAASRQSTTTISRDRLNALAQPKKRG